jgi:hypothetical protein
VGGESGYVAMMDATLRIKNLSIALEALSRINIPGSLGFYNEIETLLSKEIYEAKKETQWPNQTARPAMPVYNKDYDPDDIPF